MIHTHLSDSSPDRAGVRRPRHIPDIDAEVEGQQRFPVRLAPDLDHELRRAGDEDIGQEGAPLDGVDRGVVRLVRAEVLAGVLRGAQVDHSLLRTNQILSLVVRLECQSCSSVCKL